MKVEITKEQMELIFAINESGNSKYSLLNDK